MEFSYFKFQCFHQSYKDDNSIYQQRFNTDVRLKIDKWLEMLPRFSVSDLKGGKFKKRGYICKYG